MRPVKALTSCLEAPFHSCHRRSTLTESLGEVLEDSLPGGLSAVRRATAHHRRRNGILERIEVAVSVPVVTEIRDRPARQKSLRRHSGAIPSG